MSLKLKVCGMRDSNNIQEVLQKVHPDYMGFIFYEKSPRNAEGILDENILDSFPAEIKKTGVFVNADLNFILGKVKTFGLQAVQLHGNESPEFCNQMRFKGLETIKVFSIGENFDLSILKSYNRVVDYYLFDTKGKNHGGNGEKFNWSILETDLISKPFFLSGGIDVEDMVDIQKLATKNPNLFALDVNSKFEISPGLKDINRLTALKSKLAGQLV